MKYRRTKTCVSRCEEGKRWEPYAYMMRGSWCTLGKDAIGQSEYDPLPIDMQVKFNAMPEGAEVGL